MDAILGTITTDGVRPRLIALLQPYTTHIHIALLVMAIAFYFLVKWIWSWVVMFGVIILAYMTLSNFLLPEELAFEPTKFMLTWPQQLPSAPSHARIAPNPWYREGEKEEEPDDDDESTEPIILDSPPPPPPAAKKKTPATIPAPPPPPKMNRP
jgi:hypothetical protein